MEKKKSRLFLGKIIKKPLFTLVKSRLVAIDRAYLWSNTFIDIIKHIILFSKEIHKDTFIIS